MANLCFVSTLVVILALVSIQRIYPSGELYQQHAGRFRDWSRFHKWKPEYTHFPSTLDEITNLVKNAGYNKQRIRVIGAGHSWNGNQVSDSVQISLDDYNAVLHVDNTTRLAHVQAGIRLKHLTRALNRHGLAMCTLGSVSHQSIAGAISTATHGTGSTVQNIPSFVEHLQLVTASGDVLELDKSHKDFPAALVAFGTAGIITEVKLRVCDRFRLKNTERSTNFTWIMDNWDYVRHAAQHVKLWILPHTNGHTQLYMYNRTTQPANVPHPIVDWFTEEFLGQHVAQFLMHISQSNPWLGFKLNKLQALLGFSDRERIDESHRIFNVPVHIRRHREMEYALPIHKCKDTLRTLVEWLEDSPNNDNLLVNFPIEVRFVKADNIWMSPVYKQDSCYIGVMMYMRDQEYLRYRRFAEPLLLAAGGRPHWGKIFDIRGPDLINRYPRGQDFLATIQRLDPHGIFRNDWANSVLGLESS